MAQLLAGTTLSSEQRIYLDGISRSGDGLLVIINDILDFSKIEMGKLDVCPLSCDGTVAYCARWNRFRSI